MKVSIIQDLLLQPNSEIQQMAKYVHDLSLKFLGPAMIVGLAIEYFRDWNFIQIIKQTLIAILGIYCFSSIHTNGVNYALEGSSKVLIKYSRENHFIKKWTSATSSYRMNRAPDGGIWSKFKTSVKTLTNDFLAFSLWVFCMIVFLILKQLYSFVYHLTYAFFPICAVLSIFPLTRNSMAGAIKSSLWCMLMPFLVAIMLCVVGNSLEFKSSDSEYLTSNLEGLIQLVVSVILILWTTVITQKILDGTGISAVAAQMGQMASMATLLRTKQMVIGQTWQKSTGALAYSALKGANSLSSAGQSIRTKRGLEPSTEMLLSQGKKMSAGASESSLSSSSKSQTPAKGKTHANSSAGAASSKGNKVPPHEKAILFADSIVNYSQNKQANLKRLKHAEALSANPDKDFSKIKLPLQNYKTPHYTSFKGQVLGIKPKKNNNNFQKSFSPHLNKDIRQPSDIKSGASSIKKDSPRDMNRKKGNTYIRPVNNKGPLNVDIKND